MSVSVLLDDELVPLPPPVATDLALGFEGPAFGFEGTAFETLPPPGATDLARGFEGPVFAAWPRRGAVLTAESDDELDGDVETFSPPEPWPMGMVLALDEDREAS